MKYKCYTRWNKTDLICLCKVGNPACYIYKTCEEEEFEHKKYEDLTECMKHDKYKRINKVIKQIN